VGVGWSAGGGVLSGDPSREDVVGVVGQVVPNQRVEQILVAANVSGGEGDELAVPGGRGVLGCPGEELIGLVGDQRRGHEQQWSAVGLGPLEDLRGSGVVIADQPADQVVDVIGHGPTVERAADDALTRT